jgi:hypothetical protein
VTTNFSRAFEALWRLTEQQQESLVAEEVNLGLYSHLADGETLQNLAKVSFLAL